MKVGPIIPTPSRYSPVAIALHWLSVLLIVCGATIGLWMTTLAFSPLKFRWYGYHKWIGITVFLVAGCRLVVRALRAPPPLPDTMPRWQRRAANASHVLLYGLMLAIPLSGWLYSSATGVSVVYLGLVPLPDLVPKDKALAAVLKGVHVGLNSALALLVIIHAGAALRHHFIERDGVLARMLPFLDPARERIKR
jgi:cytochrome b561